MMNYTITRVNGKPDWDQIPSLSMEVKYLQTPDDIAATAQICYDDTGIWVHLRAYVKEIRAVEQGPYGMPCEDSCLEFFFQPVAGDDRYINLEFNSNGCYYFGTGTGIDDLMRMLPEGNGENLFSHEIARTDDGWEIFYQIPYSVIRRIFPSFTVTPGMTIRANCYACSDLSTPSYYLSWSEVLREPFTFHRSSHFGSMTFSE